MSRKRWGWVLLIGILYFGMMGAGSCGKKAKDQIGRAEAAVEEAKQAQAPEYAPDEYKSAEESLDSARQQFDNRRYKKAEEDATTAEAQARDARDKALAARRQAEEEAARRRAEEERRLARTNTSALFGDTLNDYQNVPSEEELARQVLHDVHFAFDSSELNENARGVLDLNIEWLKQHPNVKIEIEGHTDEQGTEEYNLALGARRAKAVYDYLVAAGIAPGRMRTISYGESMPLNPASTEEAWSVNRRAHFAVMQ